MKNRNLRCVADHYENADLLRVVKFDIMIAEGVHNTLFLAPFSTSFLVLYNLSHLVADLLSLYDLRQLFLVLLLMLSPQYYY
jgi:hypothetical protein